MVSIFVKFTFLLVLESVAKRRDSHGALQTDIDVGGDFNPDDVPTEEELKQNFSGDWPFHVKTTACHGNAFDNGAGTPISRIFLPFLCVGCVGLVLWSSRERLRKQERGDGDADKIERADRADRADGADRADRADDEDSRDQKLEKNEETQSKRLFHVDFARICAVICVIVEHSGGISYSHRNVGFGLWWALPYLYVTSGMSSMMTKSSMCGYAFRLLIVFTAGVSANLFADVMTKRDWKHDFGNTIFQMFFVVMLLIMAPLAEPLRQALRTREKDGAKDGSTQLFTIFWGTVLAGALAFFVRGFTGDTDIVTQTQENVSKWIQLYAPVLRHTPLILVHVGGTLFLSLLAAMVCRDENTGMIGWVLLAFSYMQMVVIPWDKDSFFHLVNLNIVGMVTFQWPLAGSEKIATLVKSYWPFLLMLLCLDSMPDMWGRCDLHSPYSTWERFRMFLGEFTLVVCFIAGAFSPSDPNRVTAWLNLWSLYAYCFHVMWYRLFGSPYGAIITFAGIPMFYFMTAASKPKESQESQEPKKPKDSKA